MKVKITIELNTETGEYSLQFHNSDNPSESIDYNSVKDMVVKVFALVDDDINETGIDSNDKVTKMIH